MVTESIFDHGGLFGVLAEKKYSASVINSDSTYRLRIESLANRTAAKIEFLNAHKNINDFKPIKVSAFNDPNCKYSQDDFYTPIFFINSDGYLDLDPNKTHWKRK